ncbi:MAG: ATP-binding cassette domain-containing protein [Candidatus Delongbacteria bacterium]|nr:ATP-binding cassette domain-containing protein [Candidatus Delongbacteria bacterium]
MTSGSPLLEARGLAFRYPGGFGVGPLDLQLRPGELLLLAGPSGAGKSTLLDLLAGSLSPASGRLLFRQSAVLRTPLSALAAYRRRIGIVDHRGSLLADRSLRENLDFALAARGVTAGARRRERLQLLGRLGLLGLQDQKPATLSTGEGRRAQLALALSGNPDALLLDEPLGNLPREIRQDLFQQLLELRRAGTAILMTTHDDELLGSGEGRVLRMDHGRLSAAPGSRP